MPRFTDQDGNVWEATGPDDPNPVFVSGPVQAPITIGTPNPAAQYEAPKAAADLANTQNAIADRAADNARADRALALQEAQFAAQQQLQEQKQGGAKPVDTMKIAQLRALEDQLARVSELYRAGPGSTSGVSGIQDFLPTQENDRFNAAGAGLAEVGLAAFRVPGVGAQSDRDLEQFVSANKPSAGDRDAVIEEKLRNLRTRLDNTYEALGIKPEGAVRTDGGQVQPLSAAGAGATEAAVPYPDEGQAEHDALVASLIAGNGGRLDPKAYARARAQLDRKYGLQPNTDGVYEDWARGIDDYLKNGGTIVSSGVQPAVESMGFVDRALNNAVSTDLGAGAAGYLNSAGMGIPELLTGDNMDAIRDAHPLSTMAGEIGGAVTGAGLLGNVGRSAAGMAGRTLSNTGRAQFGRNLATDAVYGGIYGGATEGDALSGAALGTVGSVGGQALGKLGSGLLGGARLSAPAQRLREAGVSLSPGRILGDTASRFEDKMVSWPIVGDAIRNRQQEAFQQFNREAFRRAGDPIGFATDDIGDRGVEQLGDAVGNAYDRATAGVSVPFDDTFMTDMGSVYQYASRMPQDRSNALGEIVDARVGHLADRGTMTGAEFQQAMRALKANRAKVPGQFDGFEDEYRTGVSGVMAALDGTMRRGGGADVVEGLDNANAAYRNLKILEDASLDRAKIGTQTGEAEVFLPSQLIAAARNSEKKYGPSALKQYAKDGQAVLPSTVPNSGTADRMMVGAAGLAGLGSAAGGEYAMTGDASNTMKAAGVLGGLAAMNTRTGQRVLESALLDRPGMVRNMMEEYRMRRGLFGRLPQGLSGHAAVPLVLPIQ